MAGGGLLLYLRIREWLAGQGPRGSSFWASWLMSAAKAASGLPSLTSLSGNQPEPRSSGPGLGDSGQGPLL